MSNEGISKEEYLANLADMSMNEDTTSGAISFETVQEQDSLAAQANTVPEEEPQTEETQTVEEPQATENTEENTESTEEAVEASEENIEEEPKTEGSEEATEYQEIDPDATYKLKVDGKEIEIKGSDLKSKASGEIAVEKRFNEVDKIKKAWQADKDADLAEREQFKQRIEGGDLYGALGDMFGIPGYVIKENLLESMQSDVQRRMSMTDSQLQAERLLEERKYYKDSYESEIQRRQEEQRLEAEQKLKAEEEALNQEIDKVREAHNISDDDWKAAFKELDQTIPKDQELTIEMVRDHIVNNRVEQPSTPSYEAMTNEVLEPYAKHVNNEFRDKLVDFLKLNPETTREQVEQIVKQSVSKGLEAQLTGGQEAQTDSESTREEKLRKLQEESLGASIGNTDTSKNWF